MSTNRTSRFPASIRTIPERGAWPLAVLLCACQSRAPRPRTEEEIAGAVGLADAVSLRVAGALSGAAAPAGPRLDLEDALRRALATSPELQASLARVQVALAEADQARLIANPILGVVLRFPEGGGQADVEAGATQELLALFQRPRRIDAADHRLRSAVADSVSTSLEVVAELRERYAAVQGLSELTPLLRERRALLERLIGLARARLEAGEASRLDVTTLESQGIELDLEIGEREAELREARLALARSIGEPLLGADWELDTWATLPSEMPAEEGWIRAALEKRPEIQSRHWELAALGDEAALARLSWLEGSGAALDAERDGEWSLGPGAALPLPLFDDGSARVARERAAILEARHELVRAQRQVVEEVRRAHAAFLYARENLERVQRELIPLQRERREQVEAVYLAGEADVTAVLLAEQDLQAAQAKLVELEERVAVSLVRLERAVGGPGVARTVGERPAEDAGDGAGGGSGGRR